MAGRTGGAQEISAGIGAVRGGVSSLFNRQSGWDARGDGAGDKKSGGVPGGFSCGGSGDAGGFINAMAGGPG